MRVQFELDRDRDDRIVIMFCGSLFAGMDRKYVGPVATQIVTPCDPQSSEVNEVRSKVNGPWELKVKSELNGSRN